jgi:hypothetical protein
MRLLAQSRTSADAGKPVAALFPAAIHRLPSNSSARPRRS